jgi:hypothetical protein
MAFNSPNVSPEAESTARSRYAGIVDDQISRIQAAVFDQEVAEVLRSFERQAQNVIDQQEQEALDAVSKGQARAREYKRALAALQKIKAAA